MILLTTSRRPSRAIRTLCNDLANSIPNVVRINRGKMSLEGIAERAIELEADRVVIIGRWLGGPGEINLFQIVSTGLKLIPPLMLIAGVRLQREFKGESRRIRLSVITMEPKDYSELGRYASRLSKFFDLPILFLDEAARKCNASMHLSFDFLRRPQITFLRLQRIVEIGPRITLSKLVWEVSP